jgi:tRNA (guanine37-N1)-methyltransferase
MKIDVLTLFPEMFEGPFNHSIVKIAKEKGLVDIKIHNLRDWATDSHKTVDDKPYGGGKGMVIRVDIVDKALRDIKGKSKSDIKRPKSIQA